MIIQPEDLDTTVDHTIDAQINLKEIIGDRRRGNKPNPAREILEEEEAASGLLSQTLECLETWQESIDPNNWDAVDELDPEEEQKAIKQSLTGLLLTRNALTGIYCLYEVQETLEVLEDIDKAADILIFSGREGAEI